MTAGEDSSGPGGAGSESRVALLILCIGICLAAAAIGSFFTIPSVNTWYAGLVKPSVSPPPWLFGPVWTVLYLLMGVSLYFVAREDRTQKDVRLTMGLFGLQLFLNILWSFLFFGLHSPFLGLIDIVLLWAAIAATIRADLQISRGAAYLLMPYILWVSFAGVLNAWVFVLNP